MHLCLRRICILIMFVIVSGYPCIAQTMLADTSVVAFVNGEPIIVREFMKCAEKRRSQVIRYFRINYGSEYNNEFWSKAYDGKTPSDILKKETLDTLEQIKIQQISAKKWGIVSDISYMEFLRLLQKENNRRLEARKLNKVIYGPVQYSEDVYYNYLFTNMVNQLKNVLDEKVFSISDEKLKQVYEIDKNRLYRRGYYMKIRLIGMKIKPENNFEEDSKLRKDVALMLTDIADSIFTNESYIAEIKEKYKKNQAVLLTVEDIIYNDSVYSQEEDNAVKSLVKEAANKMLINERSPVKEYPDALYIFQVKEKRLLGYRSFNDCKRTIRASFLDKLYLDYIHNLVLKSNVQLNSDIYRQINF